LLHERVEGLSSQGRETVEFSK